MTSRPASKHLTLIVDGEYLYIAIRDVLGRPPNRSERLDYQRIYRFAQTLDEDGYLLTATYHQRRHDMATSFYTALDAIGYDCVLTPYMEGWRTVKSEIAATLRRLTESTDDVMFVGGDAFSGEITDALRDLRTRPDGTPRRVVVAHFDQQTEFHASEFETLDLVRDIGALPVRFYEAAPSTEVYPFGYPQPGAATEAHSPLASALQEALADAPEELIRKAPEPTSYASAAPADTPRPQLVLIDHENIDWTLGIMIEPLRLDEQTRPRWEAIKRFATSRANGGPVLIKSFLQDNDRLTGFAQFLRNELGIVPVILAPEDDTRPERQGKRRPVVDEAIYKDLAALVDRHCDVLIVSNDAGYLEHMAALRDAGVDTERRFAMIGFREWIAGPYHQTDWIETFDLEDDLRAFTYPLPGRLRSTGVDDYDPLADLADFGLEPATD